MTCLMVSYLLQGKLRAAMYANHLTRICGPFIRFSSVTLCDALRMPCISHLSLFDSSHNIVASSYSCNARVKLQTSVC